MFCQFDTHCQFETHCQFATHCQFGTHCQSCSHSQLWCQRAHQTDHAADVRCAILGNDGIVKPLFLSVAFESGGGLRPISTTRAVMDAALSVPRVALTDMFINCGVDGVVHFTQTSWLPPAGIIMELTV
jgi:hypothetical protein